MDVLLTLLISVSVTMIVVRGKIAEPLRLWLMRHSDADRISVAYAINCPQCTGVWIGLAIGLIVFPTFFFVSVLTFGTSLLASVVDKYLFS